jgi:hypothetical protein
MNKVYYLIFNHPCVKGFVANQLYFQTTKHGKGSTKNFF